MIRTSFLFAQLICFAALINTYAHASVVDQNIGSRTLENGAVSFEAQYQKNIDGVSIIQANGNYDRFLDADMPNQVARELVSREFYKNNGDNYDFLVVFSSFEFERGSALAFHTGVSNQVQGIGLPIFSNSRLFGSNEELKGYIDMASINRYNTNQLSASVKSPSQGFDLILRTLAHETLHQWAAHTDIDDLQGEGDGHWSFFLDTDGSVEYGHDWRDNQDGTFTAEIANSIYSPLDLYLMGLNGVDDVPDMFVITPDDDEYKATDLPKPGITIQGTRKDYSIQDIVSVQGARFPDSRNATKVFRYGFIYLTKPGEVVGDRVISEINGVRRAFSERFAIMTGGKAIAVVYPEVGEVSLPGETDTLESTSDESNQNADTELALSWLVSQRKEDGNWADKESTAVRDTAVIYSKLKDYLKDLVDLEVTEQWMQNLSAENVDSAARILRARTNRTDLSEQLSQDQNQDGGWGVSRKYSSNVLDTSLAICALRQPVTVSERVSRAVSFIYAMQNSDGGWGNLGNAKSSVSLTARVLENLACARQESTSIDHGLDFLAQAANIDGGFGDQGSSVHETAAVLTVMLKFGVVEQIDFFAGTEFIARRQSVNGDWDGSTYTTALATGVLRSARFPNLLIESVNQYQKPVKDGDYVKIETVLRNDSAELLAPSVFKLFLGNPLEGGVEIASTNVPALPGFGSISVTNYWDSYDHAGQNTIYAFADADEGIDERIESDNIADYTIEVEVPSGGVELLVSDQAFSVDNDTITTLPSPLNLSVTVRNTGELDANAVPIQLWEESQSSENRLLETKVVNVGSREMIGVNFNHVLINAGTSIFTIVVDPEDIFIEEDETNNSATTSVTTIQGIDLEVLSSDIASSPQTIYLNQQVRFSIKVRNRGTSSTPNSNLVVSIRNEESESELENLSFILEPAEEKEFVVDWLADFQGQSILSVELDPANLIAEIEEHNNTATLAIDSALATGTNLTVNYSELNFLPRPGLEGMGADLEAVIRNTGTSFVAAAVINFYDGNPSQGGELIASTTLNDLGSGNSQIARVRWIRIPDSNDRFVYVVIDPDNQIEELSESDNSAFQKFEVLSLPDLAIASESIQANPTFPRINENANFTAVVSNVGMQDVKSVQVAAYFGENSSGDLIAEKELDIAKSSDVIWEFDYVFPRLGTSSIYLEIDSGQLIVESNEQNNAAIKEVTIQDGEFYLTERYMSPDGDGVQDTAEYVFNLEEEQIVSVVVLDRYNREVAVLSNSDIERSAGNVEWNGKNKFGSVVADGTYRFAVKLANSEYLGLRSVTIDTNRSALSEAIETRFALSRNLSCRLGEVFNLYDSSDLMEAPDTQNIVYGPNDQYVYFVTYFRPFTNATGDLITTDDRIKFPSGIYRALSDGSNITQIVSAAEINIDRLSAISVSPDGRKLAFVASGFSSELGRNVVDFWTVSTGGGELVKIQTLGISDQEISNIRYLGNSNIVYSKYLYDPASPGARYGGELWKVADSENSIAELVFSEERIFRRRQFLDYEINSLNTHALLRIPDSIEFNSSFDLVNRPLDYSLILMNLIDGESIDITRAASSHQWSPNGTSFAVATPLSNHIDIFDTKGELSTSIPFAKVQFDGIAEVDQNLLSVYFKSISIDPDFDPLSSLIGRFSGLAWSLDSSEIAFVVEDYVSTMIHSDGCKLGRDIVASVQTSVSELDDVGQTANSISDSGCQELPNQIKNILSDYLTLDGIYIANVDTHSIQRIAQTNTVNASFNGLGGGELFSRTPSLTSDLNGYFDSPNSFNLTTNSHGFPITRAGEPYVVWSGPNWGFSASKSRVRDYRTMYWLDGARELLVSNGNDQSTKASEIDNQHARQTVIINLDNPAVETREIFTERSLAFSESLRNRQGIYPSNTGKFLSLFTNDEDDKCLSNGETKGYRQFQSLLNLTADLRIRREFGSGGFRLSGSAVDKNFDFYRIEYADIETPSQWTNVTPASDIQLIDDNFTTWVPPYIGNFYVRLTVLDLAGNRKEAIQRVNNSERSKIAGIALEPRYISPNGDGVQDEAELHFKVLEPLNLEVLILDQSGNQVRTIFESFDVIGSSQIIHWNGRDDSGLAVADGRYSFVLEGYEFYINVDNTPPVLKDLSRTLYVPAGLRVNQCKFEANIEIPTHVKDDFLNKCRVSEDKSYVVQATDFALKDLTVEERPGGQAQWEALDEEIKNRDNDYVLRTEPSLEELSKNQYRFVAIDEAGNKSVAVASTDLKQNKVHLLSYQIGSEGQALGFGYDISREYGIRENYSFPIYDAPSKFTINFSHTATQEVRFFELLYRGAKGEGEFKTSQAQIEGDSLVFDKDLLDPVEEGNYEIKLRMRLLDGSILDSNSISVISNFSVYVMPGFGCDLSGCSSATPNILLPRPQLDIGTNIASEDIDRIVVSIESIGDKLDARFKSAFTIRDELSPTLRPGRNDKENIYAIEVDESESLALIGECGYGYLLKGLVFHHNNVEPIEVSLNQSGPCVDIKVDVDPWVSEQCGLSSPAKVEFGVRFRGGDSLDFGIDTGSAIEPLFLQIGTPNYDANGGPEISRVLVSENFPVADSIYEYMLSTEGMLVGENFLRVLIVLEDGTRVFKDFEVPVVKEAPSIDITFPQEGETICATDYIVRKPGRSDLNIKGVEIQGKISSPGPDIHIEMALDDEFDQGSSRVRHLGALGMFDSIKSDLINKERKQHAGDAFEPHFRESNDSFVGPEAIRLNPVSSELEVAGILAIPRVNESGDVRLNIEASNWSGARSCKVINAKVDADISGLDIELEGAKRIKANGADIERVAFSPNQDGHYDEVVFNYFVGETVEVDIEVFSTHTSAGSPDNESLIKLADGQVRLAGTHQFVWDGSEKQGNAVVDGTYRIYFRSKDGCGNTKVDIYLIDVDTTPPDLSITYPVGNDDIGLQVRVLGSVSDKSGAEFELLLSQGNGNFIQVGSGDHNINGLLGEWNSYGAEGEWIFKLQATDQMGNKSELVQNFVLPVRQNLISSHTTTEYFVSPNGDGRFDALTIRTSFDLDVIANFKILDSQSNEVATLASSQAYSAGFTTLVWGGLDRTQSLVKDGVYTVQVTAEAEGNIQSEQVNFEVDLIAPEISLSQLIDGYIELQGMPEILGMTGDKNFAGYVINLLADPDSANSAPDFTIREIGYADEATSGVLAQIPEELFEEENEYLLNVMARDMAGNQQSLDTRLVVDLLPPRVSIINPEEALVINAVPPEIQIMGSVNDTFLKNYEVHYADSSSPDQATLVYENSETVNGLIAPWNVASLTDGEYIISVRANDKGGLSASSIRNVIIDNLPPMVSISRPATNGYITELSSVIGVANDDHFMQYSIAIGGGHLAELGDYSGLITSGTIVQDGVLLNFEDLPSDGLHTLRLEAGDAAGNTAVIYHPFIIDTTPPAAIELIKADLVDNGDGDNVELSWQISLEPDLAGYNLYRNAEKLNQSPIDETNYIDIDVAEGSFEYHVRAVDKAGLESLKSNLLSVEVDRTPPTVNIASPAENERVRLLVDVIGSAFSATDFAVYRIYAGPLGAPLELLKTSDLPISAGTLLQWNTIDALEGEQYSVRLEAEDTQGNLAFDQVTVTIDNTASSAPENLQAMVVNQDNSDVSWEFNGGQEDLSGFLLYRNGRLVNANESVVEDLRFYALSELVYQDSGLADGNYRYQVYAIDLAGNISDPSNFADITFENGAPSAVISNVSNGIAFDEELLLVAESEDNDIESISLQYRLMGDVNWVDIASSEVAPFEYLWEPMNLDYGSYQIRALAMDTGFRLDPNPEIKDVVKKDIKPPGQILELEVSVDGNVGTLTWRASPEDDVAGYDIYANTCRTCPFQYFTKLNSSPITENTYITTVVEDVDMHYSVLAVDTGGNISKRSELEVGIYRDTLIDPAQYIVNNDLAEIDTRLTSYRGQNSNFDRVIVEQGMPDGNSISETRELGYPSSQHITSIDTSNFGIHNVFIRAGSISDNFIASSAQAQIISAGKPSAPTGLESNVSSDQAQAQITWNSNPQPEKVNTYKVYRDGQPLQEGLLIEDATASSSPLLNNSSFLPQNPYNNVWVAGPRSRNVYVQQNWTATRLVSRVELDWTAANLTPADLSVLALIDGDYIKVASFKPISTDQQNFVITLPVSVPTASLKIAVDAWAHDYLGGSLNQMRVYADELFNATDFFQEPISDGIYDYSIQAVNIYGGLSDLSEPVVVSVGDTEPPEAVVLIGEANESVATLSWTTVDDAVAYRLYRDDELITEQPELFFNDVNLKNGDYSYYVVTLDEAGNESQRSNVVVVQINIPPLSAPIQLSASVQVDQLAIDLVWDVVAHESPAAFRLYRSLVANKDFSAINETGQLQFTDTDVRIGVTYYYYVVALDDASNESAASNNVDVLVSDIVAPTKPHITAPNDSFESKVSNTKIVDIVGVSEAGSEVYLVHQGDVLDKPVFAQALGTLGSSGFPDVGFLSKIIVLDEDRVYAIWRSESISFLYSYIDNNWTPIEIPSSIDIGDLSELDEDRVLIRSNNGETYIGTLQPNALELYSPLLPDNMHVDRIESLLPEQGVMLVKARVGSGPQALYKINLDSNEFELLSDSRSYRVRSDGEYIAFARTTQNNEVEVVVESLLTGDQSSLIVENATSIFQVFGFLNSWSPNGNRLLLARRTQSGGETGLVFDYETGQIIDLAFLEGDLRQFSWSTWDTVYFTELDPNTLLLNLNYFELPSLELQDLGEIPIPYTANTYLIGVLPNQELLFRDGTSRETYSYTPPGVFQFEDVELELGDNYFSVLALDKNRNLSEPADTMQLVYQQALLPDLQLNLLFNPEFPLVNKAANVSLEIENVGTANSDASIVKLQVISPDGLISELSNQIFSELAVGGRISIDVPWLPESPGEYTFLAEVDSDGLVDELSESNNSRIRSINVASEAIPQLSLDLNPSSSGNFSFNSEEEISGQVEIVNIGETYSGTLDIQIEDSHGRVVESLESTAIANLGFGNSVNRAYQWNTANTFPAAYKVVARLVDSSMFEITRQEIAFDVADTLVLELGLRTDFYRYRANQDIRYTASLRNVSISKLVQDGELVLELFSPDGLKMHDSFKPVVELLPGELGVFHFNWNTELNPPGIYEALVDANVNNQSLSQSRVKIEILADQRLLGSLAVNDDLLVVGQNLEFSSSISNQGNTPHSELIVTYLVSNADNEFSSVVQVIPSLDINTEHAYANSINTADLDPGIYKLKMMLNANSSNLAVDELILDQVEFSVIENEPPKLEILKPFSGAIINSQKTIGLLSAIDASGVALVEVKIDQGIWAPASADITQKGIYNFGLSELSDGGYMMSARAMDQRGNESNLSQVNFVVDNRSPSISFLNFTPGQTIEHAFTPQIQIDDLHLTASSILLNGEPWDIGTELKAEGFYFMTVEAFDAAGNSSRSQASFSIIKPPIDPPVVALDASNDSLFLRRGVWGTIAVLENDQAADFDRVVVEASKLPENGYLVIAGKGIFNYFPNLIFIGSDSITYKVTDPTTGETDTAVVNVDVAPAKSCSFVPDHSTTTNESIRLLGWARDGDSSDLQPRYRISIVGNSNNLAFEVGGQPIISFPECSLTYTPKANVRESVEVTYLIKDSKTDGSRYTSTTRTFKLDIDTKNNPGRIVVPLLELLLLDEDEDGK